jgi:hypothetical protein
MKKILIPIDFSKQSEYAAKMANRIAKKIEQCYLLTPFNRITIRNYRHGCG